MSAESSAASASSASRSSRPPGSSRRNTAGGRFSADARAQRGRARLLARAVVAVERVALHGAGDARHGLAVLGLGRVGIAGLDRSLEAAEVGLDRRRVAAVLEPLPLRPLDAL